MAYQDSRLQCQIIKLTYDFDSKFGVAYLEDGECCDMEGMVKLFWNIDHNVTTIQTFSGKKEDTIYRRIGKQWEAN